MKPFASAVRSHQYRARKRAKGLEKHELWATTAEWVAIRKLLRELRGETT